MNGTDDAANLKSTFAVLRPGLQFASLTAGSP